MAGFTQVSGRYMRRGFTGGRGAIVTTRASIHHTNVTEGGAQPTYRGVTDVTGLSGRNMRCGFTRGNDTIVTTFASTQYLTVINRYHRRKDIRRVAGLANIGGTNMSRASTNSRGAVMTG